ncbi:hypothetical protein V1477_005723 [Vespula maculifrons]|uniref:Uncharacterized protein n=1 Tax=Vespula maculifrons TaxID=7453 RepID=A0ABD2CLT8_VESMC
MISDKGFSIVSVICKAVVWHLYFYFLYALEKLFHKTWNLLTKLTVIFFFFNCNMHVKLSLLLIIFVLIISNYYNNSIKNNKYSNYQH